MLKVLKFIIGGLLVDATFDGALDYLKSVYDGASKYLFGTADDETTLAYRIAESLTEQSVSLKLLSLPGGWNIILTLYRTGTISTSTLVRASLLRALSVNIDIGYVASEKLDEVFPDGS